jgi:lipid II:glycine glycyltransferase (peptidoglycan interpeptide bridge formation enzyme)
MRDLRQSSSYAEFMQRKGWIIEKISIDPKAIDATNLKKTKKRFIFAYIRKMPLFPLSVMKIQRFNFIPDFEDFTKIAKEHRVFYIVLEPGILPDYSFNKIDQLMKSYGYKKSKDPFLPSKTVQIDLNESRKDIFNKIHKKTRNLIRKAEKLCKVEIILHQDTDKLMRFYKFWKNYGKGYIPSNSEFLLLINTFGKNFFLIIAKNNDGILAGTVILVSDRSAYYYYSVTSPLGRKSASGYAIVRRVLEEVKNRNCEIFDFDGIYDERFPQLKGWKGFTAFKKKFGGEVTTYPGVYVKYLFPFFRL